MFSKLLSLHYTNIFIYILSTHSYCSSIKFIRINFTVICIRIYIYTYIFIYIYTIYTHKYLCLESKIFLFKIFHQLFNFFFIFSDYVCAKKIILCVTSNCWIPTKSSPRRIEVIGDRVEIYTYIYHLYTHIYTKPLHIH